MCSIIISTNIEEAKFLAELNKSRGSHSNSITILSLKQSIVTIKSQEKIRGNIDLNKINFGKDEVIIIHQQAPTTNVREDEFIHPSIIHDNHLWHNGIIKQSSCNEIKHKYSSFLDNNLIEWDTYLIHNQYYHERNLDNIDGSFALAIFQNNSDIYVARNEIAPLYMGKYSISSTAFNNSSPIAPNIIWKLVFKEEIELLKISTFKTKNNPYYIIE